MILTFTKKNDNDFDFNASISNEEVAYLVNFAITSLLQIGAITVEQNSEEPQEVTLPTDTPSKLN